MNGVRRNRQWVLASRPCGPLTLDQFALREMPLAAQPLLPGQVMVRNLAFLGAPTLRNWIREPGRSSRVSIGIGEAMRGPGAVEVIESASARWPTGSRFTSVTPWQDFAVLEPDSATAPVIPIPAGMSPVDALGPFGVNALTAYFGLLDVGRPKPGETVVVSAAAGSVGSVAVQIARIRGCRVIGIAGGRQKCEDWVVGACGADAAIDYRHDDVRARLAQMCPSGVDVFFDNVGGDILQAVMDCTATHARIVVCGQLAAYDGDAPAPGPHDMMRVVYWRIRIQGFLVGDYLDRVGQARTDLAAWTADGSSAPARGRASGPRATTRWLVRRTARCEFRNADRDHRLNVKRVRVDVAGDRGLVLQSPISCRASNDMHSRLFQRDGQLSMTGTRMHDRDSRALHPER